MVRHFSWFILLLAAPVSVFAQGPSEPVPMRLTRLTGAVILDGHLTEDAWTTLDPLPLTMHLPTFRGTPTQRTEIRVGYDENDLYVGAWMYDTNPSEIRINSLYRDRFSGDDALAIYVDPFNDNQNSKWFGLTAAGMRFDLLVSDDGNTLNGNWDGFWDARTSVTEEGWFAEVRIPFSTLGFITSASGDTVMGLTVTRLLSRLGERVTFPAIDPAFLFRRPSLAQDVVVSGVRSPRPVYLSPYLLAGTERRGGTARKTARDVGLDIKVPISSQLNVDVTVNTDFAQVEADGQQVALDRFPLFFPERRRFFQEGSGIFDFTTTGNTRLFHSRRIGLAQDLTPVPIIAGARMVGRVGAWDVGALSVVTDRYAATSREHFGVVRLRHAVLNQWSTAGLIVTSVAGGDNHNLAVGADTSLRARGDHYLTLKWASAFDSRLPPGASVWERSLIDAQWERRTGRGLQYVMQYSRAGAGFRPRLGFHPRQDYWSANVVSNYYFFTDSHPYFRRVYPGALAFSTFRNSDGALESGQYAFWIQADTKAGGGGWIEPKWFRENVLTPFTIGGRVDIPAGSYDFADLQLAWKMPSGSRARIDVDARVGSYFDGSRKQIIVSPTWNASKHLELAGTYQLTALRFPVRQQEVDIHLASLRIGTALNVRVSGTTLIQYNSTRQKLDLNLRFRYNFREGTDLWFVYNEGLDTSDRTGPGDIEHPRSLSRAFVVKCTRTFGS